MEAGEEPLVRTSPTHKELFYSICLVLQKDHDHSVLTLTSAVLAIHAFLKVFVLKPWLQLGNDAVSTIKNFENTSGTFRKLVIPEVQEEIEDILGALSG
jgi:hypothetical protein